MKRLTFLAKRTAIVAASAALLVGALTYGAGVSAQTQQPSASQPTGAGSGSGMSSGQQSSPALGMNMDDIKKVQEALRDKGQDVGSIDGVWGPKTQAAIRDFQQKQGIDASGNLDQETIQALGVDVSSGAGQGSGSMGSSGTTGSSGGSMGASGGMSSGGSSMGGGSMSGGSAGSMGTGGQQRPAP